MNDTLIYRNNNGAEVVLSVKSGYAVKSITGTSENTVSVATAQGIGQVGATVQSRVVQARPLTVTGVILGSPAEVAARKERLLSVILPGVDARFYHKSEYYLLVTPTTTPACETARKFANFQFSMTAAYPYWLRDANTSKMLAGLQPAFKFPWNISQAWRFATSMETVFINIQNLGQIESPFTVTLSAKGEVVNPKITNVVTGKWLQLNRTMVASERVVIEITHDLTYVTSSIDGDIRGALDIDTTLYRLDVGDNLLKPEAESGLDQLGVSIDYSIEKVGVAIC